MVSQVKNIRCVALLSGGLDSMLAAAIVKNQGVEALGISFNIGFGPIPKKNTASTHPAIKAARQIGISLEIIDISKDYLPILLNPKHGYGSASNPCIDCHIEMIRRAKDYMSSKGAQFIVTGEVMGQRPMSQNVHHLNVVAQESGAEDILLRPLSAKRLKPTLPEREGWVDREKLCGIFGRSRAAQLKIAREMGISEFAQPAGGCLLTEKEFALKFFDLFERKGKENISFKDVQLLKAGRHFRINPELKFIIGRNEDENLFLQETGGEDMGMMEAVDYPGPIAVVDGTPKEEELKIIAQILARYGQGRNKNKVLVRYTKEKEEMVFEAPPMEASGPERWRI